MAGTPTTVYQFTTLDGNDNNDSVAAVNLLAAELDGMLLPRGLTAAQRNALSGGRRPTGLIIYNTTSGQHEQWNGSAWVTLDAVAKAVADAALSRGGGTMSGAIAMGLNKVTGLANGTASTDAVNKSQLDGVSTVANAALPKAGGTMSGELYMGNYRIGNLLAGVSSDHAVNKGQMDSRIDNISESWQGISPAAPWTNSIAVRKHAGIVQVHGSVYYDSASSPSVGSAIALLPAGMRPAYVVHAIVGAGAGANIPYRVDVATNGELLCQGDSGSGTAAARSGLAVDLCFMAA